MHSHKKTLIPCLVVDKHTYLTRCGGHVQLTGVSEVAQAWSGLPRAVGEASSMVVVVWQQLSRNQACRRSCSHPGLTSTLIARCQGVSVPGGVMVSASPPHTCTHSTVRGNTEKLQAIFQIQSVICTPTVWL